MADASDRRGFLKAVLGGAAGLSLSQLRIQPAQARSPAAPIVAQRLNERLTLFSGAGCNVVAAHDAQGIALVDGGLPERSHELLTTIYKVMSARRVTTLFNTHWHPAQTGSNETIGNAGAKIIAHENTKLWLEYANPVPGRHRRYGPLPAKARPNSTIYRTGQSTIGGEEVKYGYMLQAHTDGDIYVFFPKSNVLATGGVVSASGWPIIDWHTGGWIFGMIDGLKTLIGVANDQTRIVPANGPVLTRADLVAQHKMYSTIGGRLTHMLRQGLGPKEVVAAAPTREFDAQWGDPTQFVTMAFKSLWGHFAPGV